MLQAGVLPEPRHKRVGFPMGQLDDRPIVLSLHDADTVDVANGTPRGESRQYAGRESRPAITESVRTMRPAKLRVAATLTADAVALVAASLLAVWVAGSFDGVPIISRLVTPFEFGPRGGTLTFIALTPFWLAALWAFGLYREPARSIGGAYMAETVHGLTALTAASWLLLIAMVFVEGPRAPVTTLIAFWMLAIVFMPAVRWVSRITVWARPAFQERVLIIGAGEVGHTMAAKISKHPEFHIKLVGFLDDGEPRRNGSGGPHLPVVGVFDDLDRVVVEQQVDRVIVAFSRARHDDFLRVVRACADSGVKVNIVPRLFEVVSSRALVDDVEGIPLLDVGHVELSRFSMAVKRAFDLVVGRQERMGRGGRPFCIYKFRSMYLGADKLRDDLADQNDYDGPMFKIKRDLRVTRIGGWLRRWSVDEVPQILNVMIGDMSLVGPRPLWVEEAKQCRGWTQKRLDITPGITGLWQVLGRSDIPFDEMVRLDYMYVTGWSLSWDVKLLMQTVPAVVQKRGAY